MGGISAKHIFLGEQRIATKKSNGTIQFIHSDFVDSSNVITDASGNKTVLLEYDPFGQIVTQTGSVNPRYKYTGQEDDGSASLFDYNARLYDPQLGRFITADWIILDASNPQNFNRFAYVINNPINYIDPTGHFLDYSNFQPNEVVSNYQYISIDFGSSISNAGFNITPITSQIFITPISEPMDTLYTTPIFNPADFGINNLTGFPIAELDPMTFITPIQEALGGMLINQPSMGENPGVLSPIVSPPYFNSDGEQGKPKLLNPPIYITEEGLGHTVDFHGPNSQEPGKSKFHSGVDIAKLIGQAVNQHMIRSRGNNIRIVDAGSGIGTSDQKETSKYTVVTDKANKLVTAYPGSPRKR